MSDVTHDPVNHPQHYTQHPSGVECIQIVEHMSFCRGNAMKYLWRAGDKGDELEDLRKAQWYLAREIALVEKRRALLGDTPLDNARAWRVYLSVNQERAHGATMYTLQAATASFTSDDLDWVKLTSDQDFDGLVNFAETLITYRQPNPLRGGYRIIDSDAQIVWEEEVCYAAD